MSVLDMANLIIEITGSKSRLVFRDLPEDDPKVRQPDIGLAASRLGWSPKVDIREALAKTVEWFQKAMSGS